MCPSFTREEFRNIKIRRAENLRFLQNIILFIFAPFLLDFLSECERKDRENGENSGEVRSSSHDYHQSHRQATERTPTCAGNEINVTFPCPSSGGWKNISYGVKLNLVRENLISSLRLLFQHYTNFRYTEDTFIGNLNCKIFEKFYFS